MYFLDFILFIHLQLEYEQLASAMPSHPTKTAEEASGANKEALRGGVVGAAKVHFRTYLGTRLKNSTLAPPFLRQVQAS